MPFEYQHHQCLLNLRHHPDFFTMNGLKLFLATFVFVTFCNYQYLSAGWPAWTNPAIPRSGNSEITTLDQSNFPWRLGIDYSFSNNIKAGHLSNDGLTESLKGIQVPAHRHDVKMDLKRVSVSLLKSINDEWDIGLMLPYYWKSQEASISFLEPANSLQQEYAERAGYIHHRSESYSGIGDIELLAGHKRKDLIKSGSILRLGFG